MILLIDNYDSFVYNLARYFRELGQDTTVVRNDAITPRDVIEGGYRAVVLSPGPCTPAETGVCLPLLETLPAEIPVLGVCLGHQTIAAAYGGRVERVAPMHGRTSPIHHDGDGLFCGLPNPFRAGRYHSLAVMPPVPAALRVDAVSDDGIVMAVSHRERPVFGVQFHPESVLTEQGRPLLANFLKIAGIARPLDVATASEIAPNSAEGRPADSARSPRPVPAT